MWIFLAKVMYMRFQSSFGVPEACDFIIWLWLFNAAFFKSLISPPHLFIPSSPQFHGITSQTHEYLEKSFSKLLSDLLLFSRLQLPPLGSSKIIWLTHVISHTTSNHSSTHSHTTPNHPTHTLHLTHNSKHCNLHITLYTSLINRPAYHHILHILNHLTFSPHHCSQLPHLSLQSHSGPSHSSITFVPYYNLRT
jgi:hypothetical protein